MPAHPMGRGGISSLVVPPTCRADVAGSMVVATCSHASLMADNGAYRGSLLRRALSAPDRCRAGGWFSLARSPKMALINVPSLAVGSLQLLVPLIAGCATFHFTIARESLHEKGAANDEGNRLLLSPDRATMHLHHRLVRLSDSAWSCQLGDMSWPNRVWMGLLILVLWGTIVIYPAL